MKYAGYQVKIVVVKLNTTHNVHFHEAIKNDIIIYVGISFNVVHSLQLLRLTCSHIFNNHFGSSGR